MKEFKAGKNAHYIIMMTKFWKIDQAVAFWISRNTDLKYLSYYSFLVLNSSHVRFIYVHILEVTCCTKIGP